MLDFLETEEKLAQLTAHLIELSKKYSDARHIYGQAKHDLMILLVPHQGKEGFERAAIDKQIVRLLGETPEHHKDEIYSIYKDYVTSRETYKGLEKLIDAYSSKIMTMQSLMRWQRGND